MFENSPQPNTDSLYIITEHWLSDVKFYRDELAFLKKLTDTYFIWLEDNKNIERTHAVRKHLADLDDLMEVMEELIGNQLRLGADLKRNPTAHEQSKFEEEHRSLEDQIANVTKLVRALKTETFRITEAVAESEKLQSFIEK